MPKITKSRRRHRRYRLRRKSTLGTAPGTIKPDPSSPPPVFHVIAFGPNDFLECDITDPEELKPLLTAWPVVWVDIDGFGDVESIKDLGQMLDLHPLAMEDIVNAHQRPKFEEYDHHLFVVAHMMDPNPEEPPEQVSLFFGQNFVATFQERPGGDTFEPVRERIRKARGRVRIQGPDYLAYALLDTIVDAYFPILERVSDRIDEVDSHINVGGGTECIEDIHNVRNDLLMVRRSVWPLRDALSSMVRVAHPLINPGTRIFLRDCYDHTVQIIDLAELYRELCSDLRDYMLTIVSQRTNEIMKLLTIIATIFIPLGFVAGLYGMNFDTSSSPWNMPELKWAFGYPFALAIMLSISGGLLYYFKRQGWLN